MTDKMHFDMGFQMGLKGKATKRTHPGRKAAPAFLVGNKMGLIAATRAYEDASKGS